MKKVLGFIIFALLLILLCGTLLEPVFNTADKNASNTDDLATIDSTLYQKNSSESDTTGDDAQDSAVDLNGELKSHYIDVGQGDSEFIELPNGECMLIDAGEWNYGSVVVSYIKELKYKKIDYVVVTHAHSDHMGGMSEVIKNFDIGKIYMPKAGNNTVTYENLLQTISDEGMKVKTAKAGVTICSDDDLTVEMIAPVKEYENLNDTSAVVMITYGKTKFLYMGDAEQESESDIKTDVECDVVKVGHHGSKTSSTSEFVARTHASYAVISVGKDNDYGHPKEQTLNRWTKAGAEVLRTDLLGSIIITSDAKEVMLKTKAPTTTQTPAVEEETQFVLNTNTMKIHRKDCEHVSEISPKNRMDSNANVDDLIEMGYSPCKTCKPDQ